MNNDTVVDLTQFILSQEITAWLRAAGHPTPESWMVGLKPEATSSPDLNIQRFLINRHWVQIFTSLPINEIEKTRDARGCLMNGQCELPDYIRLFKEVVIPCAMNLNLLPVTN